MRRINTIKEFLEAGVTAVVSALVIKYVATMSWMSSLLTKIPWAWLGIAIVLFLVFLGLDLLIDKAAFIRKYLRA